MTLDKLYDEVLATRLPAAQHALIRLWVLGGVDAIGTHSTRTVRALLEAGYLDAAGPTAKARTYVDLHERMSF